MTQEIKCERGIREDFASFERPIYLLVLNSDLIHLRKFILSGAYKMEIATCPNETQIPLNMQFFL